MMDRQLLDYYPGAIRAFREYRMISGTEQPEVEQLWMALHDALSDQFVLDATQNGVERWEKILKIIPKATASLDDRRFLILVRLSEELPYTMKMLIQQMGILCGDNGFTLHLKHDEYTLEARVALTAKKNYEDVDNMLRRMAPANLIIDLSLLYNKYGSLKSYSHGRLKTYSHYDLRNEVVINGD